MEKIRTDWMVKTAIAAALYAPLFKQVLNNRYIQLIPDILFVLILLALALRNFENSSGRSARATKLRWAVYLFLIISVLQIFNPNIPSLNLGLEGFRKTSFYLIALIIGTYLNWGEGNVKSLYKFILILGMPICIYAFKQYFSPSSFDALMISRNNAGISTLVIFGKNRAFSIFASPFTLGYFGNIIFAIGLYFYANERKWVYLLAALVGVGSVVLSNTRVNLVAAFMVFSLVFLFYFFTPRRFYFFLGILLLLVPVFIYVNFDQTFAALFQSLSIEQVLVDQRFITRFDVYQVAFEKIRNNWLLGYGVGSAGDTLGGYFKNGVYITPHNMFIKVFFETGIFGLLIFFSIWIVWLLGNRKSSIHAKSFEVKSIYQLGFIVSCILLINGLTGGALDSFPANVITFMIMGVTYSFYYPQGFFPNSSTQ